MVYVFGNAITNKTLEAMNEYHGKSITLKDRARVALMLKTSEDKALQVRELAEKLKQKSGEGVATVCLVYNATGDALRLVTSRDWSGKIGFIPYPPRIENGQWGVFLHQKDVASSDANSVGAVVYRGKNATGEERDWMQAWKNKKPNKAYSEIRDVGHWTTYYDVNATWGIVFDKLNKSSTMNTEIHGAGSSVVVIGNDTCSVFEAILLQPN